MAPIRPSMASPTVGSATRSSRPVAPQGFVEMPLRVALDRPPYRCRSWQSSSQPLCGHCNREEPQQPLRKHDPRTRPRQDDIALVVGVVSSRFLTRPRSFLASSLASHEARPPRAVGLSVRVGSLVTVFPASFSWYEPRVRKK